MKHAHYSPDAFCLVRYQDKVSGASEILWNARDAEAPPSVLSSNHQTVYQRMRAPATYSPRYIPQERTRVIINLTQSEAIIQATKEIKENPELTRGYASQATALELFAKKLMGDGNAPQIVLVDYALRRKFTQAANAMIGDASDHAASQGTKRQLLTPEYREMLNPLEALHAFTAWLVGVPHPIVLGGDKNEMGAATAAEFLALWASQQIMDPVRPTWDRLVKSVDYPGELDLPLTPAEATQDEPKGQSDGEDAGVHGPTGLRSETDEARSSEAEV